jgi:hypothetical protein
MSKSNIPTDNKLSYLEKLAANNLKAILFMSNNTNQYEKIINHSLSNQSIINRKN